jgi:hypothetical protein
LTDILLPVVCGLFPAAWRDAPALAHACDPRRALPVRTFMTIENYQRMPA